MALVGEAEREGEAPRVVDVVFLEGLQMQLEGSLLEDGGLREVGKKLVVMTLKRDSLAMTCSLKKLLLSVIVDYVAWWAVWLVWGEGFMYAVHLEALNWN